jgi:uroporphyrinogen-III decarboxylase
MEKKWEELSSDERQEEMFQRWLSPPGIDFVSPEAEKLYKERATRIKDAIQLKKLPDRVPIFVIPSFFPAIYSGMTPREVMYDYDKCYKAWKKFYLDFDADQHGSCVAPGPGRFFDILDFKLYAWPGHGVSPNHTYQCLEGEYMKADEYDALIQDPSNFYSNIYMPRIFGALESFNQLPNLASITEMYGAAFNFIPYGLPPVQSAHKALLEAGSEALKWAGVVGAFDKEMTELGYPHVLPGFTKAPFDVIGDTLRGTKGIMLDMYRQPDKLLEAMEAITPIWIKIGVSVAKMTGNPMVFIPLHKGADGFLSDKQFKTFYWPTFRKVLMGLIDEGCVPFSFVEGSYNTRLEVIRDLPKGKVIWLFDLTDMAKAKEILGDVACIGGGMPLSLLTIGTPQQVKDYAKKLIDTAGKDGGYIMSNGAFFDDVKPENLKAMVDFTKEYGVYK